MRRARWASFHSLSIAILDAIPDFPMLHALDFPVGSLRTWVMYPCEPPSF